MVEIEPKSTLLTHMHDRALPWLGACTSIERGGAKLEYKYIDVVMYIVLYNFNIYLMVVL